MPARSCAQKTREGAATHVPGVKNYAALINHTIPAGKLKSVMEFLAFKPFCIAQIQLHLEFARNTLSSNAVLRRAAGQEGVGQGDFDDRRPVLRGAGAGLPSRLGLLTCCGRGG